MWRHFCGDCDVDREAGAVDIDIVVDRRSMMGQDSMQRGYEAVPWGRHSYSGRLPSEGVCVIWSCI